MDESKNSSNGGDLVGLFKDPEFAKLDDKEKVRVLLQVEPDLAKCNEHEWNYIIGEVAARADEELTAARRAQMQQQRPTTPEEPEQGEESYVARVAKAALNVASAFGVTEYDPSAAALERDKQIAEDFIGSAAGRAASFVLAYPLELAKNIPQAQVNLERATRKAIGLPESEAVEKHQELLDAFQPMEDTKQFINKTLGIDQKAAFHFSPAEEMEKAGTRGASNWEGFAYAGAAGILWAGQMALETWPLMALGKLGAAGKLAGAPYAGPGLVGKGLAGMLPKGASAGAKLGTELLGTGAAFQAPEYATAMMPGSKKDRWEATKGFVEGSAALAFGGLVLAPGRLGEITDPAVRSRVVAAKTVMEKSKTTKFGKTAAEVADALKKSQTEAAAEALVKAATEREKYTYPDPGMEETRRMEEQLEDARAMAQESGHPRSHKDASKVAYGATGKETERIPVNRVSLPTRADLEADLTVRGWAEHVDIVERPKGPAWEAANLINQLFGVPAVYVRVKESGKGVVPVGRAVPGYGREVFRPRHDRGYVMIDVNRPAHEAILATLFHEVGHKTQLVLTAEQWGKFTNLITREYTRQVQVGEEIDWHGYDVDHPQMPILQAPTITPVHKLKTSSPAKAAIEHRFGQFLDKPGEFMAYTNQNKYSLKDVLDMAPDQLAEFIGGNEVVRDELWANFFRSGMFSPQFRMKTIAKLQALHPELPAAAIGNLWCMMKDAWISAKYLGAEEYFAGTAVRESTMFLEEVLGAYESRMGSPEFRTAYTKAAEESLAGKWKPKKDWAEDLRERRDISEARGAPEEQRPEQEEFSHLWPKTYDGVVEAQVDAMRAETREIETRGTPEHAEALEFWKTTQRFLSAVVAEGKVDIGKVLNDPRVIKEAKDRQRDRGLKPNVEQRESPEFKKWWRKGTVVNKKGEPRILYHAGQHGFDQFENRGGMYGHFGTLKASMDRLKDLMTRLPGEADRVYPVWVRIEKAARFDDIHFDEFWGFAREAQKRGYITEEDIQAIDKRIPPTTPSGTGYRSRNLKRIEAVVELLKSKGYDGIVYRNKVEDLGEDSYIPFSANQVKSALGNVGAFSLTEDALIAEHRPKGEVPERWKAGTKTEKEVEVPVDPSSPLSRYVTTMKTLVTTGSSKRNMATFEEGKKLLDPATDQAALRELQKKYTFDKDGNVVYVEREYTDVNDKKKATYRVERISPEAVLDYLKRSLDDATSDPRDWLKAAQRARVFRDAFHAMGRKAEFDIAQSAAWFAARTKLKKHAEKKTAWAFTHGEREFTGIGPIGVAAKYWMPYVRAIRIQFGPYVGRSLEAAVELFQSKYRSTVKVHNDEFVKFLKTEDGRWLQREENKEVREAMHDICELPEKHARAVLASVSDPQAQRALTRLYDIVRTGMDIVYEENTRAAKAGGWENEISPKRDGYAPKQYFPETLDIIGRRDVTQHIYNEAVKHYMKKYSVDRPTAEARLSEDFKRYVATRGSRPHAGAIEHSRKLDLPFGYEKDALFWYPRYIKEGAKLAAWAEHMRPMVTYITRLKAGLDQNSKQNVNQAMGKLEQLITESGGRGAGEQYGMTTTSIFGVKTDPRVVREYAERLSNIAYEAFIGMRLWPSWAVNSSSLMEVPTRIGALKTLIAMADVYAPWLPGARKVNLVESGATADTVLRELETFRSTVLKVRERESRKPLFPGHEKASRLAEKAIQVGEVAAEKLVTTLNPFYHVEVKLNRAFANKISQAVMARYAKPASEALVHPEKATLADRDALAVVESLLSDQCQLLHSYAFAGEKVEVEILKALQREAGYIGTQRTQMPTAFESGPLAPRESFLLNKIYLFKQFTSKRYFILKDYIGDNLRQSYRALGRARLADAAGEVAKAASLRKDAMIYAGRTIGYVGRMMALYPVIGAVAQSITQTLWGRPEAAIWNRAAKHNITDPDDWGDYVKMYFEALMNCSVLGIAGDLAWRGGLQDMVGAGGGRASSAVYGITRFMLGPVVGFITDIGNQVSALIKGRANAVDVASRIGGPVAYLKQPGGMGHVAQQELDLQARIRGAKQRGDWAAAEELEDKLWELRNTDDYIDWKEKDLEAKEERKMKMEP